VDIATCTLDIDNFESVDTFVLTARSCGFTTIDLNGRSLYSRPDVSTLLDGSGLTYMNGSLGNIAVPENTYFNNCKIDKVRLTGATEVGFVSCRIGTLVHESQDTVITLIDSWVAELQHNKNLNCVMGATQTVFNSSIGSGLTQGAVGDNSNPFVGGLTLLDCAVYGDIVIRGALNIERTEVRGSVWTQDFVYNGDNFISSSMKDCVISGRHLLQHYQPYRTGVKTACVWINNTFSNTEKNPIYPESWSDPLGEGTFTRNDCSTLYLDPYPTHHTWIYKGNTGPKIIPEYPKGSYTSIINIADTHGVEGYATIQEVPYVAPGHSIKAVHDGEDERMDYEDLYMNDLKVNLHFYRELYWTGSHETVHRPDPLGNAAVVRSFSTNKDYTFDGGYHWTCKPRKTTAFWENSSEAYFRIMFDIDSDNHDWGNMEEYGCLDIMPYTSVKYTG